MGRVARRPGLGVAVAVAGVAVLCSCSGNDVPAPRPSATPPAVQSTVPVGATVSGAAPDHVMPDGHSMSGMSMSGMSMSGTSMSGTSGPSGAPAGSAVPNGTGSRAVAAPNVDGCNRAYGDASQCVPLRAPGGGPITCPVLRTYHYLPLLVTRDPLHLLTGRGATVRVTGGRQYLTGCAT